MNKRFAISYRGYNTQAVEAYLNEMETTQKGALATFKTRITALEKEKMDLKKGLEAYQAKEQALANALVQAQEMVQEAKQYARRLAETEQNRLALFCDKWTAYAQEAMDQEQPAMCQALATMQTKYAQEVATALQQNLFCYVDAMYPEYRAEQQRVGTTKQSAVHIEELLQKLQEEN